MWDDWLRGTQFVKAERIRQLAEAIPARSRQSIELKFMNIRSVTSEQMDVYLEGYRPLPHIQNDLRRSVSEYLARNRRIMELLEAHKANSLPPSLPLESATEDLVVAPPAASRSPSGSRPGLAAGAWTAADDFRRRDLGRSGEELVIGVRPADGAIGRAVFNRHTVREQAMDCSVARFQCWPLGTGELAEGIVEGLGG